MKIAVIGATGMVGSRVVTEAVSRGLEVDAYSRSGKSTEGAPGSVLALADTDAVVKVVDGHDVTVIAVPGDRAGGSTEEVEAAHRALIHAAPRGRVVVVGGAGSLTLPDGTLLKDADGFPAEYKSEADGFTRVLDLYRNSTGVDWTMIAPSPVIAPGERTGSYVTAADVPAGQSISAEDFAVAVVDEAEKPQHRGSRFTAAGQ